jgi:hypothetical protein
MSESKEFYDARFKDLTDARNAYLNHWQLTTDHYRQENRVSQWYRNYSASNERERTAM